MGPKGKRLDPPERPFLFVNEDFNSLFGRTRNVDLDRTKQSHVQRQSFARRKKGSAKKRSGDISPANNTILPPAGSSTTFPESESFSSLSPHHNQTRFPELTFLNPDTAWLPTIPDPETSGPVDQTDIYQTPDLTEWQTLHTAWPSQDLYAQTQPQLLRANSRQITARLAYPTSERSSPLDIDPLISGTEFFHASPSPTLPSPDPFIDMKTALELWAPPLMRIFAMEMVSELFDTDLQATSLDKMRHVSGLHADMQSCMVQPAEMYSLLTVTSLVILSRRGQLDLPKLAPDDSARVPLMFKLKALEALRLRLSSGNVTHGTVLAVHRMVCAALFNGNYATVETHYRACISLMESLGGLETFDDYQKERLILHDLYYAFATVSSPRLRDSWDPGPIPNEIAIQIQNCNEAGGERLRTLVEDVDQNIHPEIGEAILELMETRNVFLWLQDQAYRPTEYRWLMHRRLAIVYKLINIEVKSTSENELQTAIQNVLRYAVVYYAMAVISYPLARGLVVDHFTEIAQQLWGSEYQEDAWLYSTDLLLWTVVILSLCITFGNHGQRTTEAFSIADLTTRLGAIGRMACRELEIGTEAQLIAVLRTFLFEDRFVDERFKTLIEESLGLARS